ncbi:MAG: hypothetical protein GXO48_04995 [Chlorobi bacterium]|nr:hypothetical protein [Chlorobiota bacterium]
MKSVRVLGLTVLIVGFVLGACSPEFEDINYGTDQCDYCKMTIVDNKFSAQLVTKKGRNYKFDAIECMIWFLNDEYVNREDVYAMRVADYTNPGNMLDAEKAYYLISPQIRSPMGANLAAFPSMDVAQDYQNKLDGEIYTLDELFDVLKKRKRNMEHDHHHHH